MLQTIPDDCRLDDFIQQYSRTMKPVLLTQLYAFIAANKTALLELWKVDHQLIASSYNSLSTPSKTGSGTSAVEELVLFEVPDIQDGYKKDEIIGIAPNVLQDGDILCQFSESDVRAIVRRDNASLKVVCRVLSTWKRPTLSESTSALALWPPPTFHGESRFELGKWSDGAKDKIVSNMEDHLGSQERGDFGFFRMDIGIQALHVLTTPLSVRK